MKKKLLLIGLGITLIMVGLVPSVTASVDFTDDYIIFDGVQYYIGDEITSLRDQYSKTTYGGDHHFILTSYLGSIHYEDSEGNYQPIDTTIIPSEKANWNWEVTTGHWQLFLNNDTTVGVKKGNNWVGHRLQGVAYLDIDSKEYTILQSANAVTPTVTGNVIQWDDVFYGIDYRLIYTNDSLKEDIIVNQKARDYLNSAGKRPQDYGLDPQKTYLVFVFEADWSESLPMKLKSGTLVNPDLFETEGDIHFESEVEDPYWKTKLVSFLPSDYVTCEGGSCNEPIRKRLIRHNDKNWLLLGARVIPLNQMPEGAITFDPTETLRPAATGDECNIPEEVGAACPNHYQNVDEEVTDENTTANIVGGFSGGFFRDLYNLADSGVGMGAINSVTVWVRGRYNENSDNFKICLKSGGVVGESSELSFTSSYANYSKTWNTPPEGGSWNWTKIDALQAGISMRMLGPGGLWCTQVWVIVDYTAAVAPTVTTNAATYVQQTTARLNGTLNNDGGEPCEMRFQYYTGAGNWTDNETEWVDGYTTGQHPYEDIDSLTANTLYHFRVQADNGTGVVSGDSVDFTTTLGIEEPTNFKSFPSSNNVVLSWTKGAGATETLIRYTETGYTDNITGGMQAYLGTSSSTSHTGLLPGHSYYYSAWGKSGTTYSDNYTTIMATTLAIAPEGEAPDAPTTPATWFQAPDYTVFSPLPIYNPMNKAADALQIPRASFWLLSALLLCVASGIGTFAISRHAVPTLIVLAVALALCSLGKLLPMWMMAFSVIFALGAWQIGRER